MNTSKRVEQINQRMLQEFDFENIEDTPENRHDFLQGMKKAWDEDRSTSTEKTKWMIAITAEIARLARVIKDQSK